MTHHIILDDHSESEALCGERLPRNTIPGLVFAWTSKRTLRERGIPCDADCPTCRRAAQLILTGVVMERAISQARAEGATANNDDEPLIVTLAQIAAHRELVEAARQVVTINLDGGDYTPGDLARDRAAMERLRAALAECEGA